MNLKIYDSEAQEALVTAQKIAKSYGHQAITPLHLAKAITETEAMRVLAKKIKASYDAIQRRIEIELYKEPKLQGSPTFLSDRLIKIAEAAETEALSSPEKKVRIWHLLGALLKNNDEQEKAAIILDSEGVNVQKIYQALQAQSVVAKGSPSEITENGESALQKYALNITRLVRDAKLDPVVGRKQQLERLIQVLSRRTKNNPILIGEPGVGKNSIVRGLAQRIVSNEVPVNLRDCEIVSLDIGALIAGATLRGQFEERLRSLLSELKAKEGRTLLLIEDIHNIVGAGGDGASDAANLIKPALSRGEIQAIGTTTAEAYKKTIEKDAALERRFQPIFITEPKDDEALEILRGIQKRYETYHGVSISEDALQAAVKMSKRYIVGRCLPEKAIDLIDEASARMRIMIDSHPQQNSKNVEEQHIAKVVADITQIPVARMLEGERSKLKDMENRLGTRVIGQLEAVKGISNAVRRARSHLQHAGRPVGSFLFLGPTGVGKTELAKALSEFLFDDEKAIIRFDMSEFMEKHAVARLIGAPPGYVGSDEGGQLTEGIRRRPYAVVLFDEMEKAHPDVLNILLQILDDGRLTDSQGRLVDFSNAVVIMTSNLGSFHLLEASIDDGVIEESAREMALAELRAALRPEFLNRIDEIVMFHGLTREDIERIAEIQLKHLDTLLKEEDLKISFSKEAKKVIIDAGFEPAYGARPLKRAILRLVQNPLAQAIVEGKFEPGSTIKVTVNKTKSKDDAPLKFV